jgi:hypothetical protein
MKSVHPLFSWNFYGIISISFYGRRGLYSTINKTDAFAAPGCCLLTGGMTMDFKNKKTTIALIVCAVILARLGEYPGEESRGEPKRQGEGRCRDGGLS